MVLSSCEQCGKRGICMMSLECDCQVCEQCLIESVDFGECVVCGERLSDEEGEEE